MYGLGKEPQSVSVVWRDLRHALTGEAGLNALIDLHVDGAAGDLVIKEMRGTRCAATCSTSTSCG